MPGSICVRQSSKRSAQKPSRPADFVETNRANDGMRTGAGVGDGGLGRKQRRFRGGEQEGDGQRECSVGVYARPHPDPLPRGEGGRSDAVGNLLRVGCNGSSTAVLWSKRSHKRGVCIAQTRQPVLPLLGERAGVRVAILSKPNQFHFAPFPASRFSSFTDCGTMPRTTKLPLPISSSLCRPGS